MAGKRRSRKRLPGFITLSKEAGLELARRHQGPPWFGTLVLLLLQANDHGEIRAPVSFLAEQVGMNPRTFHRHLEKLVEVGEIEYAAGVNQHHPTRIAICRFEEISSIVAVVAGAVGSDSGVDTGSDTGVEHLSTADASSPAGTRPRQEDRSTKTETETGSGEDNLSEADWIPRNFEGSYIILRGSEVVYHAESMPEPDGPYWSGDPTDEDFLEYAIYQERVVRHQAQERAEESREEVRNFLAGRVLDVLRRSPRPLSIREIGDGTRETGVALREETIARALHDLRGSSLADDDEESRWYAVDVATEVGT